MARKKRNKFTASSDSNMLSDDAVKRKLIPFFWPFISINIHLLLCCRSFVYLYILSGLIIMAKATIQHITNNAYCTEFNYFPTIGIQHCTVCTKVST